MTEHELDTLLRDYGGAVRSVCRAILPGHPQDAEEAEADTFYKLWRGAHLPADETHRRRLVVQAARQCAIDRYRALLRRGETLPLDDRDDAELAVALESELETRELMAQVMALPPPDGELFLRRYECFLSRYSVYLQCHPSSMDVCNPNVLPDRAASGLAQKAGRIL